MAIILRVFKGTTIVDYHSMLHTNTKRNFAGRRADTAKGRVRSPATGRVVYSPGGVRGFFIPDNSARCWMEATRRYTSLSLHDAVRLIQDMEAFAEHGSDVLNVVRRQVLANGAVREAFVKCVAWGTSGDNTHILLS